MQSLRTSHRRPDGDRVYGSPPAFAHVDAGPVFQRVEPVQPTDHQGIGPLQGRRGGDGRVPVGRSGQKNRSHTEG